MQNRDLPHCPLVLAMLPTHSTLSYFLAPVLPAPHHHHLPHWHTPSVNFHLRKFMFSLKNVLATMLEYWIYYSILLSVFLLKAFCSKCAFKIVTCRQCKRPIQEMAFLRTCISFRSRHSSCWALWTRCLLNKNGL